MFTKSPTLEPVIYDCDPKAYHAIGADIARGKPEKVISQTELKEFAKNPHRWVCGYREEDTDAKDDGHLCDVIVLTPDRFEQLYAVAPEVYPSKDGDKPWNWNATFCKEWKNAQEELGLAVVKSGHAADAWKAREALLRNGHIKAFHSVSRFQVQVNCRWEDPDTAIVVPVKCLLDIVPDPDSAFGDTLADYKRTNNAEYRAWARTVHNYGLAFQAAFYLDAINAATGLQYRSFEHWIQESVAPWECTHRMLSSEFITIGRNAYQTAFSHYCRALKTGCFPGYDSAIVEPEAWMV